MEPMAILKMILREREYPFFTDEEIAFHLGESNSDVYKAAYRLLCIKAEQCTLQVSGLTLGDTSAYWKSLAGLYRPNGSCIVEGG